VAANGNGNGGGKAPSQMWEDSRSFNVDVRRTPRIIKIFGDIGYPDEEDPVAVTALEVTNEIIELVQEDHHLPIYVLINSDGGSVYEGLSMLDAFDNARQHGVKIVTRCQGRAQSMGADLLILGGDWRTISRNSFIMIHGDWCKSLRLGDALDVESEMRLREIYQKPIIDLYVAKTKLPRKYWEKVMKDLRPVYFTPDEALAAGLVDEVF